IADGTRAVEVNYDAARVPYKVLLGAFLRNVDPTAAAQFPLDEAQRGPAFRSVIWVRGDDERNAALQGVELMRTSGVYGARPWRLEVLDAGAFEPMPDDGQDFVRDNAALAAKLDARAGRSKFFERTYK
ncbi:hypothetical protein M885DRAFT_426782, partial [Pelagophyceae sp. CCMP2097]